jgi:poly(3-hydroxybutyrate) depolymerase
MAGSLYRPATTISFLPNRGNDWWYGCCDQYPTVTSGTVVNYTERYLLALVDWVKANYAVNTNRVYLQGGSMGGTGSVSFGLRHPEVFAAIRATVPQVNPKAAGVRFSLTLCHDMG